MGLKNTKRYRPLPWRWSWKIFAVLFLLFLAVNYSFVRYASRRPLFNTFSSDLANSVGAIQSSLKDQLHALLNARGKIEEIRLASAAQLNTVEAVRQDLNAEASKKGRALKETQKLK